MSRALVLVIVALAGCGRVGFDARAQSLGSDDIALVQDSTGNTHGTSLSVTASAAFSIGDTLIATITCHYCAAADSLQSVTGGGATWTDAAIGPDGGIGGNENAWIYSGEVTDAGQQTVAIAMTLDDWAIEVSEWSGVTTAVDDAEAIVNDGLYLTTATSPTVNAAAGDLIVVVETDFDGSLAIGAPSNGFVGLRGVDQAQSHNPAYRIASQSTGYQTTWQLVGDTPRLSVGASFAAE